MEKAQGPLPQLFHGPGPVKLGNRNYAVETTDEHRWTQISKVLFRFSGIGR